MLTDDKPDFSAEAVAAARAFAYKHGLGPARNPDNLASCFLGAGYRVAYRVKPLGLIAYRVWQRTIPGIAPYLNARTHHIDHILLDAIRNGFQQIVILGAGYDSRCWRFAAELDTARIFEVDRAGTQKRKQQLASRLGPPASGQAYVAVDFEVEGALFEKLREAGYLSEERTLFLWEGVAYYLAPDRVDALLEDVSSNSAFGSLIAFDYLYDGAMRGEAGYHGALEATRFLSKRGQPYKSSMPQQGLVEFMGIRGYEIDSDLDREGMWKRYLRQDPNIELDSLFGGYGFLVARVAIRNPPDLPLATDLRTGSTSPQQGSQI